MEAIHLASETKTKVIDIASWINEITGNKAGIVHTSEKLGQGHQEESIHREG